ncbi:MAG: hypothetical protein PHU71_04665 [Candidatus Gracilibacteria bacterium]|nr:hypothetical protein [Candidatus Gracilibacteria bacterium]
MKLKTKKTQRGFDYIEFTDYYGEKCSIQKSSLGDKDAIWMGVDDANPQIMASKVVKNGTGWVKYPLPDDVLLSTRMHLTKKQVKQLLPILIKFIETGEIV